MTSILDILKNNMTEPQKTYIAIAAFFEHWYRCKSLCDAFFKDAQRSYQHMNLSEAKCFYDSMCECLEGIDPFELHFEADPNPKSESND